MGILRLILALTVLLGHGRNLFGQFPISFVGSTVALQSFYIISGFYMALILNEKYTGARSYRIFITNRFLRLFPAYWAALALTVLMMFVFLKAFDEGISLGLYIKYFHLMDVKSFIYMILTNIFIFGQDLMFFAQIRPPDGSIALAYDFDAPNTYPPLWMFLFINQGWSLAVELTFYLVAPLLVRRKAWQISAVIAASLALRFYIYGSGLHFDPWTHRFFPNEIALFLLGSLAYKLYRRYRTMGMDWLHRPAFVLVIGLAALYQFIPGFEFNGELINRWALYAVFVAALPAVFLYTKDKKLDNYLGELSYPLYISHMSVLYAVTLITERFGLSPGKYPMYFISIVSSILVSIALIHLIIKPVDRYRQALARAVS